MTELRISILHVRDCPSVPRLRTEVHTALEANGSTAVIEEVEGKHPSPTLLINGAPIDGFPLGDETACRIDVPTQEQIRSAIEAASGGVPSSRPEA